MIGFPAPLVAAIAVAAFVAGGSSTYYVLKAKRNAELVQMYKAGEKVVAKREEQIARNLEIYREELAGLRNRPPKRVFLCPERDLPEAPGRTNGADPAVIDRRDYGPDLRAARDALIQCKTLMETLK